MPKEIFITPIVGTIVSIENVNDEVFSQKMLGDGIAVKPSSNNIQEIVSPVDGEITILHDSKHAFSITTNSGIQVLIHVGLETVKLNGEGFKALKAKGDTVKAGDAILSVDFGLISKNELVKSTDVIIIFIEPQDLDLIKKSDGESVKLGDTIVEVK